jgi:hypothetical protein
MAVYGHGFLTETPDTYYGDDFTVWTQLDTWAQRFQAPGTGTIEISEIGIFAADSGDTLKLGIFTDDAINGCPATLVSGSEKDVTTTSDVVRVYGTFSTKPQLTGGEYYWLCGRCNTGQYSIARYATGGTSLYINTISYPDWPTDTQWHSHNDLTRDFSVYVIYAAVAAGQYARPNSDISIGNWTNEIGGTTNIHDSIDEETTPVDTDYIKSGANPTGDTVTIGLSAIDTPVAGTVKLRIRMKSV